MMLKLIAAGACVFGAGLCPPDPNYEPPQPFAPKVALEVEPSKTREQWEAAARTAASAPGADRASMTTALTGNRPWRYGKPLHAEDPAFIGLDARFTLEVQAPPIVGGMPNCSVLERGDLAKIVPADLWDSYKATLDASGVAENNDLFDPASVLAAVHALHAKGKTKAVETMEWHLSLSGDECAFGATPFNADATSVCVLAGLLFERPAGPERWWLFPFGGCGAEATPRSLAAHPLFPLIVQDGIPFWLGRGWMLGGVPGTPGQVLHQVGDNGVLTKQPLTPTCDPVTAAEHLFTSAAWKGMDTTARAFNMDGTPVPEYGHLELREAVIIQALRALPPDMRPAKIRSAKSGTNIDEEAWAAAKKAVIERHVRWDGPKKVFIADPVAAAVLPIQPLAR
jgi:hypothetical protein